MKCSMIVVLALVLVASCHGFICPNEVCKDADCTSAPTKESCKGTLIPNGSFCGCCNTCVDYINLGGKCTVLEEMGNGLLMKGICAPGLVCHKNICKQVDVPPMLNLN